MTDDIPIAGILAGHPFLGLALGSVDSFLIFLLLAIISGIYNWVQKRSQPAESETADDSGETGEEAPRPRPRPAYRSGTPRISTAPPAPARRVSEPSPEDPIGWALREFLDLGAPPAPEPPPLPPEPPPLPPAPARLARPVTIGAPLSRFDERVARDYNAPTQARLDYARRREEKAGELDETAAAEVAAVVPGPDVLKRGLLMPSQPAPRNPALVASLRNRKSLRQLVLASAILGPPKALMRDENTLF